LNQTLNKDEEMINLIHIAQKGHYPLFQQNWIEELDIKNKLSNEEIKTANAITARLKKHKNIERKKIILFSLSKKDRDLFINAFINTVEKQILNNRPKIQ